MTLAHLAALLLNPRTSYVGRHRAPELDRVVAATQPSRLVTAKQS